MLKFIKSKAFKVAGLVFAFAFAFTLTANAATYDFGTATLRVGSTGQYVINLQSFLNDGIAADGKFGPITKAKVMAWQASVGLTADGVFGPMSRAKAMGGVMSGNFPAGCTSAAGYSPTTGVKCDSMSANTFAPAGCTSASGFSPVTGGACYAVSSTPTGSTTLSGGAGSATITELSSPSSNTKVGEGDDNIKVLGIEVEADNGSDLAITSMKISLQNDVGNTLSGSDKLNRYAESVSIWYNDVKVGSADVDDFSESAGVYTKSITLTNAIVKADKTGKFYVAVDAIADVDSANSSSTNNTWTATLSSTRYQDATGAILTDTTGSIANTFIFDTLANTNDVELKINLASDTVTAKTVKISTTSDTNQVELMKFTMKAQGSAMVIDQIPVLFTTDETDLDQVTSNVTLKIDGNTFNESVTTSAAATATVDFDDLNISLDANETITGIIYADINDIESSTFDEGTTLNAAITSGIIATTGSGTAALDAEDSNGDQVAAGDRTGSAQGNTLTFRSTGVNTVMGTVTYDKTEDSSGNITQVIYTIPVAVTSFGNTLYMGQTAQLAATASASNAFALVFQNSSAPTTSDVIASASMTLSTSDATIETNGYRLDDGQTKHFTIEVTLITPTTAANSYRVALKELQTFTNAALYAGASSQSLLPVENFQTAYKYITS